MGQVERFPTLEQYFEHYADRHGMDVDDVRRRYYSDPLDW